MRKWFMRDNGNTFNFGDEEEIRTRFPDAIKLPDRPSSDYEWKDGEWKLKPFLYKTKRAEKYPSLEDQVDSLMKQFDLMRKKGLEVLPELSDLIDKRLQVKNEFPKP